MCGRFAQGEFPASIRKMIKEILDDVEANHNIAPTETAAVITREPEKEISMTRMSWGFQPQWKSASGAAAPLLINARADGVAVKPAFRDAYRRRRCLLPATGFYEWRRDGAKKTPFYFSPTDEENPLMMGGLWEERNNRRAFLIITTDANGLMKPVHNRMPVIIRPENWLDWLDPRQDDFRLLNQLHHPVPDDYLRCRQVSPLVNNPRNKA